MPGTRRVAERMIFERAARARRIARELRDLAGRLQGDSADDDPMRAVAVRLRELAAQVEKL